MSNRTVISMVALALLMLVMSPVSNADRQDPDMADRIYEKFKEREQDKRDEKRKRGSSESQDRSRNEREQRSGNQSKSRDVSRAQPERSSSRSRSDSRDRRNSSASDYQSSARDERNSDQAGEQLSREIRNLLNRKSRSERSAEPASRRSYSGERNSRATSSESGGQAVREKVSLDQAVNIVRRQSNGKVISARTEGSGATRKHRIKVLIDDRRVRTYVVSAATGKVY